MRWAVAALAVLALCAPAAARAQGLDLTRVTTGPSGGNADVFTEMLVSSADGARALFVSDEALTPEDHRAGFDYYERVGSTTRLLAQDTGTDDPRISMGFYFASADATRIVFAGPGHWVAGDTDDMFTDDVYTAVRRRSADRVPHPPSGWSPATPTRSSTSTPAAAGRR